MTSQDAAVEDSAQWVLSERRGAIGLITINRAEAKNAVNSAMSTRMGELLEEMAVDPEMRAVVITGVGDAFCAGADLKEIAAGRRVDHREWGFAGLTRHFIDTPVVAAVNGFAVGGGTELALACDLVVADEHASFGLPEVKRGLLAGAGGLIRLQRQVPLKIALEVALTGDTITATEAARWGLVNRVAPSGQALDEALALAGRIAANAPLPVQASKRMLHKATTFGSDWDDAVWELNKKEAKVVFTSEDAAEGVRAFAERRAPVWRAR